MCKKEEQDRKQALRAVANNSWERKTFTGNPFLKKKEHLDQRKRHKQSAKQVNVIGILVYFIDLKLFRH